MPGRMAPNARPGRGAPLATLSDKIQNALDEGRILVLGTQIFLGLE
jgi:hypothetical protein